MNEKDQKMLDLLKEVDFHSLLCVPVVQAKVGSGYEGRMQRMIHSEPINLDDSDAVEQGKFQLSVLIQACNVALKEIEATALCVADIAWRSSQADPSKKEGIFSAWMMTEPMENVTNEHFTPILNNP